MTNDETKLIADFVASMVEKYGKNIYEAVKSKLKKKRDEFMVDFGLAFKSYTEKSYEKYSKVKTLLYRIEPRSLSDFFEAPYLQKGSDEFLADDVNHVLNISNFVLICGDGGVGKSILLRYFFLNELKKKDLTPILVELKDLNDSGADFDIKSFFLKKLSDLGGSFDPPCLEYALTQGYFLFLLDGYDELYSKHRGAFDKKFEEFCDKYPNNSFILSSRPFDDFVYLQRFTVLKTVPFNKKQTLSLVGRIPYDKDIKKRFIDQLKDGLFEKHRSFASNPLLLTIMLLTFENYAEIPDKLHLFYANAFDTLLCKHDASKSGYRREFQSLLSVDEIKKVFSCFCFLTYARGRISFSQEDLVSTLIALPNKPSSFEVNAYIHDLTNALCVMHLDGAEYRFTHRSFQEYFTAVFLKDQSDEIMKKYALQLVKNDTNRACNDSMFFMLHDMTEERFEKNVLLPLLDELEENVGKGERFDYFFASLFSSVGVDTESSTNYFFRTNDSLALYCYEFMKYYSPFPKDSDSSTSSENELSCWLEKQRDHDQLNNGPYYVDSYSIPTDVILSTEYSYKLLKKTRMGIYIAQFAQMRETILKKRKENESIFDSFLNLSIE